MREKRQDSVSYNRQHISSRVSRVWTLSISTRYFLLFCINNICIGRYATPISELVRSASVNSVSGALGVKRVFLLRFDAANPFVLVLVHCKRYLHLIRTLDSPRIDVLTQHRIHVQSSVRSSDPGFSVYLRSQPRPPQLTPCLSKSLYHSSLVQYPSSAIRPKH